MSPAATSAKAPAQTSDAKRDEQIKNKDENATRTTQTARQWLVRVVKREATIGPHTFHLHEIYGQQCCR